MTEQKNKHVTRENLYQQVWEIPISRLAVQYGISDRGLSKICARLNIPTPGRGYWARKTAGKHVIQYQLPEPDTSTSNDVVITETDGLPQPKPEIQASLSKSIDESNEIIIPERLLSPHPVIKAWLDDYKRQKQEEKVEKKRDPLGHRYSAIYKLSTFTPVDRYRHRILHVLFNELELQGYVVKSEHYDSAYLEYEGIQVEFTLREKLKQNRRPLTEEEKTSYFTRDKPYIQELEPTGKLHFSIKTYLERGIRHEWNETKTKSFKDLLPEIIATFKIAGPLLVEKEQKREDAQRQYREEEQQRYLEEIAFKKDQNQWREFLSYADAAKEAVHVREFITAIEKNINDGNQRVGDRTLHEWLTWATEWADHHDPLTSKATDLFDRIAKIDAYSR